MNRRTALHAIGASITTLAAVPAVGVAGSNDSGAQPVGGDLPNENVPNSHLDALPPSFGTTDTTREVGTFLTLSNGWAGDQEVNETLLNSTKQTFTFGDQTFVLESVDDWNLTDGIFYFSHSDTPKGKDETVEVSWDVVVTESYYDPIRERQYEQGDQYLPAVFPTARTYEIVGKNNGES